jgi:hypothetical protein
MKDTYYLKNKESHSISIKNSLKFILFIALIVNSFFTNLNAQVNSNEVVTKFNKPTWWFGAAVAANLNQYRGSTQQLTDGLTSSVPFKNGNGIGLFAAPSIEYHPFDSRWGLILQAGYDNRSGDFDQVLSPCNCPRKLSAELAYISVEPMLRFAPLNSNFYLFGGPRIAFNVKKSFVYRQKNDPLNSDQTSIPDVVGDFSQVNNVIYSLQFGAGYDIYFTSLNDKPQFVVSPFISFQPYFGQDPRLIETWNNSTIRVGATIKFGRARDILLANTDLFNHNVPIISDVPTVKFSVYSPKNIVTEHRVREIFPLRNYVFFDLNSTEIPERYVLLTKSQVKNFKEEQLEVLIPKRLSGRSSRQMIVYYNVMNILGDRMDRMPQAKIKLIGASELGIQDGLLMAKSIQTYLHDIFGIDTSRIAIEGSLKPKLPSMEPSVTREIALHKEGDRRVSIESSTPGMLMEFQSGPDAPLKPIELNTVQIAPVDSYVTFNNEGGKNAFISWSIEVKNENGDIQYFGPFDKDKIAIPGKSLLGTRSEGKFKVTMIGLTKNDQIIRKDTTVKMVLWTPPKNDIAMRYSILYGYNNSKAIDIYQKYLIDIVIPKIPRNGKVLIHGYTDILGVEFYNVKLSEDRALDVFDIMSAALSKLGRTDVSFVIFGFGEDLNLVPFDNGTPEERFYNRTVIIDIITENK